MNTKWMKINRYVCYVLISVLCLAMFLKTQNAFAQDEMKQQEVQSTTITAGDITELVQESIQDDMISLQVLTDKTLYNMGDTMHIILNVKNNTQVDIYSLHLTFNLPENVSFTKNIDELLHIEKLSAGENKQISVEAIVRNNNEKTTAESVTEKTTESVTEVTTEKTTESVTEATTEKTTESVTEATTEKTIESVTEATTEKTTENIVETDTSFTNSPSESENADDSTSDVNTGDKNKTVLFIVMIIICIIVIVMLCSKKCRRFLAMFLCIIVTLETININNINLNAAEEYTPQHSKTVVFKGKDKKKFQASKTITIDNKNSNINVELNYDLNNEFSMFVDSFKYDDNDNIYYVMDKVNNIEGTLIDSKNVIEMSYSLSDQSNNILKKDDIKPSDNWKIGDFGLIVGKNILNISVKYNDSSVNNGSIVLYNLNEENMENVPVDKNDSDGDGILNYLEDIFGTDKYKADTDGDGLDDYEEIQILGTDPLKVDSDGNGVSDDKEDFDGDGLDNLSELRRGLNPLSKDTDGDGLSDSKEIELKTNPLVVDTDGDGASDYWEYLNGFNPCEFNKDFNVKVSNTGKILTVGVNIELDGKSAESLSVVENTDTNVLNRTIPGYIDSAYDFSVNGTFDSAELLFEFPKEYLNNKDFEPAIYYYNTETQMLEELPTTVVDNCAKATVQHFSTYILLNKKEFDAVWSDDIEISDSKKDSINMAFVIDYSASMDENDPKYLRKELTKNFIDKLRNDKDKAAIIKFAAKAVKLTKLTSDKEKLYNAVNSITNNSGSSCDSEAGTNGSDGIKNAIDLFKDTNSETESNYIVFMTDGEDTSVSYDYDELINTAIEKNIRIFTIGLGNANEELLKKIADKTNGKYYYATIADIEDDSSNSLNSVFADIQDETIDKKTDTNNDGISDYLTKKICEKELRLGTGASVFNTATYEKIQENDDYDGDGLKNGEELEVVELGNKIYLKMHSYPDRKNSDSDSYSDYTEAKSLKTNPMVTEMFYDKADMDYVTDNDKYVSTKYKNFYDNKYYGWLERGSVWIGNNIFGSNYSKLYLYKSSVMDYFQSLYDEQSELDGFIETYNEVSNVLSDLLDNISYAGTFVDDLKEGQLSKLEDLRNKFDSAGEYLVKLASKGIKDDITNDPNFVKLWDAAMDDYISLSDEVSKLDGKVTITKKIDLNYSRSSI